MQDLSGNSVFAHEREHLLGIGLCTTLSHKGVSYTQYGPIKNDRIKNQHSDFEKNKEPALRILDLKNRFTF